MIAEFGEVHVRLSSGAYLLLALLFSQLQPAPPLLLVAIFLKVCYCEHWRLQQQTPRRGSGGLLLHSALRCLQDTVCPCLV
jgi:hypothetical protein